MITNPAELALQLTSALAASADPAKAAGMAAYMRHRFEFLGVTTPERRRASAPLIRAYAGDPVAAAKALWGMPEREYQYVACDLLRRWAGELDGDRLPALADLAVRKSWWDTVDGLAVTIGDIVRRDPAQLCWMDAYIDHENLWLRRVAILHQLAWKEGTEAERLFGYCLKRGGDKDFFIRKAIGWALRQYARVAPAAVADFLERNRGCLSPLSLREAAKHL